MVASALSSSSVFALDPVGQQREARADVAH